MSTLNPCSPHHPTAIPLVSHLSYWPLHPPDAWTRNLGVILASFLSFISTSNHFVVSTPKSLSNTSTFLHLLGASASPGHGHVLNHRDAHSLTSLLHRYLTFKTYIFFFRFFSIIAYSKILNMLYSICYTVDPCGIQ